MDSKSFILILNTMFEHQFSNLGYSLLRFSTTSEIFFANQSKHINVDFAMKNLEISGILLKYQEQFISIGFMSNPESNKLKWKLLFTHFTPTISLLSNKAEQSQQNFQISEVHIKLPYKNDTFKNTIKLIRNLNRDPNQLIFDFSYKPKFILSKLKNKFSIIYSLNHPQSIFKDKIQIIFNKLAIFAEISSQYDYKYKLTFSPFTFHLLPNIIQKVLHTNFYTVIKIQNQKILKEKFGLVNRGHFLQLGLSYDNLKQAIKNKIQIKFSNQFKIATLMRYSDEDSLTHRIGMKYKTSYGTFYGNVGNQNQKSFLIGFDSDLSDTFDVIFNAGCSFDEYEVKKFLRIGLQFSH